MILYAGVGLGWQTQELCSWLASTIDPTELWTWSVRSFPGARLTGFPFRQPHVPRRIELANLFWPTSASRFSHVHFLADQSQLDAIRAYVYSAGAPNNYQAAPLIMDDGTNAIATNMWMLPPRPLAGVTDLPLHLLTLVDERFFWWFRTSTLSVLGGVTTWDSLIADIAAALGITLTVDTLDAAYLYPDPVFTLRDEPLPVLLDAACYCVGRRFVRQLDGTCRLWSPVSSRDQTAANLARVPTPGNVDVSAGGVFALGTSAPLADDPAVLPAAVEIIYPVRRCGVDAGTISYNVQLTSLALPDFAGVLGFLGGTKTFHATAVAGQQPTISPPYNDAELQTLSEQIATDFYRQQVGQLDLRLVGYPAWVLTGLDDHAEYSHDADCGLRVVRGPWLDHLDELLYWSTYGSSPSETIPPVVNFVEITSLTQNADGLYPARIVTYDKTTKTWIPGQTVWWRDANQ